MRYACAMLGTWNPRAPLLTHQMTTTPNTPADPIEEQLMADIYTNLVLAMLEQGCPMDTEIVGLDMTLGQAVQGLDQ